MKERIDIYPNLCEIYQFVLIYITI